MGLYNMLFGVNPAFPILLSSLNLSYHGEKLQIDGDYSPGRFRNIFLETDGSKVVLYTRNGGGNRDCWDAGEECETATKPEEHNHGCVAYINWKLTQHPLYIRDYDDDFDCTYASFEFNLPEILDKVLLHLNHGETLDIVHSFDLSG